MKNRDSIPTGLKLPFPAKGNPTVTRYLRTIGRLGGLTRSPRKQAAARANGLKPCAPGKRRGRPKKTDAKPKPVTSIEFECPGCHAPVTISGEAFAVLKRGRDIAVKCQTCEMRTRVPAQLVEGL